MIYKNWLFVWTLHLVCNCMMDTYYLSEIKKWQNQVHNFKNLNYSMNNLDNPWYMYV